MRILKLKTPKEPFDPDHLGLGIVEFPPGRIGEMGTMAEPYWNLEYTLSGTVRSILPQGEVWHRADDLMVLKPGASRGWEVPKNARKPWRVIWFVFVPKPEWIPLLNLPEELPKCSRTSLASPRYSKIIPSKQNRKNGGNEIRSALIQACEHRTLPGAGLNLTMNCLERALLWLQMELQFNLPPLDSRVRMAMELIANKPATPPSISALATHCDLSAAHLRHLFLSATGTSPHRWMESYRLKRARDMLLSTGLPVKHVAIDCGYKNQRHFSTRFRKYFGISPTECLDESVQGR